MCKLFYVTYLTDEPQFGRWLSRVLLASGAKRTGRLNCCKMLLGCPNDLGVQVQLGFSNLELAAESPSPEKSNWSLSRENVSVTVHSGRCIDFKTKKINWYYAIDYRRYLLRRKKIHDLVENIWQSFSSLGG